MCRLQKLTDTVQNVSVNKLYGRIPENIFIWKNSPTIGSVHSVHSSEAFLKKLLRHGMFIIHLNKSKELIIICRGLYLVQKLYLFPPPSENDIFPPSQSIVFLLLLWPFCLNSSLFYVYFTFSLPLSSFFFPFLPFSFPFFFFLLHFPLFSSPFHVFLPNDIGW